MKKLPRVVITAAASGSGKTLFTMVLLHHLQAMGSNPIAYKCGPDYIDPMFHERVTGIPCRNLDPFFYDKAGLCQVLSRSKKDHDVAVLEGVMGYYDGGDAGEISTWTVAKHTDTKAVLLVDAKGTALTALAAAQGLAQFQKDSQIAGVIFNRMHRATYEQVKRYYERGEYSFALLGHIPVLPKECMLESRHLGLVTPQEVTDLKQKLEMAYGHMKDTVDWDGILRISEMAGDPEEALPAEPSEEVDALRNGVAASDGSLQKPVIAVAKDDAFCFYYEDHFELLRSLGCEISFFSPLLDEEVPSGACGLWLGGGYPELYLEKLSQNKKTMASVRAAFALGMPMIAECGGFMYLNRSIEGYAMCGILPGEITKKEKLVRFGYVTLTASEDGLLLGTGQQIRGHEFHYYDSTENGSDLTAHKRNGMAYPCAVSTKTMYAGFPHICLGSQRSAAKRFVSACRNYQRGTI